MGTKEENGADRRIYTADCSFKTKLYLHLPTASTIDNPSFYIYGAHMYIWELFC
jgi:hypothetical protein